MIGKSIAFVVVVWALGFVWFSLALPQAAPTGMTSQAVVVPTGEGGRIPRGLEVLRSDLAAKMLVTGVDTDVRPAEFAAEFEVSDALMDCCVTLGFDALDTRGNASETAKWVAENDYADLRLVTSDWHMRRTVLELSRRLPDSVVVIQDAVKTEADLSTLFVEYHKLLAAFILRPSA